MFQILAVEDSTEYQKIIAKTLTEYEITFADTAEKAAAMVRNKNFDIILIDINLPDHDGYFLLSEIQSVIEAQGTSVLFLTGRSELTDKVTAFSLGADDYITKPFEPIELRARVAARLKKSAIKKKRANLYRIGELEIDHERHRIMVGKGSDQFEAVVTQTEFKLLTCLGRRPEQVFSRDQLLVAAWGDDAQVLARVVDVHMCSLRKKLKHCADYIKAVKGIGYKLVVPRLEKKVV